MSWPAAARSARSAVAVGSGANTGALQINASTTIGTNGNASVTVGGATASGTLSFLSTEAAPSTLTINNTSGNTGLTLGGSTSGGAVLNFNTGNATTDVITTGGQLVVNSSGAAIFISPLAGTSLALGAYNLINYASQRHSQRDCFRRLQRPLGRCRLPHFLRHRRYVERNRGRHRQRLLDRQPEQRVEHQRRPAPPTG